MNTIQRMQLENVAMEAEERAADAAEFASWGTGRRARASFAIAALQLDYSRRIVDVLERIVGDGKPCIANDTLTEAFSGVVQKAAPQPVAEPAAEAEDAGSNPAPAAKPDRVRKPRRRRG